LDKEDVINDAVALSYAGTPIGNNDTCIAGHTVAEDWLLLIKPISD
jgi:hypothetical protein